jgi:YlmC/YmxH family sporulation protein
LLTKTSELREREVVNIIDGRRLGLASDLEIDLDTGRIKAIVVPGAGKFLKLFGRAEVILVETPNYVADKSATITLHPPEY